MGAVDVWCQETTERFIQAPWLSTLLRWTGHDERRPTSAAATIAEMDRAGVDVALMSAWHGPAGSLVSNDEVSAAVSAFPDRMAGLMTVDLTDTIGAVREIRKRVGEGFVGVRIVPWLGTCHRTTADITRSTSPASTRACPSAPRSATPVRCGALRLGGPFPISRTSFCISPSSG